jgi:hypothetical protein
MIFDKAKESMMKIYCPEYLERMPKEDDSKTYNAVVYKFSFVKDTIIKEKKVKGIIKAYKTARWLALKADMSTPKYFGIGYFLEEIN